MKRFMRFLLVGGAGFAIDPGMTHALILSGLSPGVARVPAIGVAMLATWLANRHFTYQVATEKSPGEAFRYGVVAAVFALLNYLLYLVLVHLGVHPALSVALATVAQTFFSFHAYRHFVFRERRAP